MALQETVHKFKEQQKKMCAYNHAMGLLYYDSVTGAPSCAADALGATMAVLSEESYKLFVNDELRTMLKQLLAEKENLDAQTLREAEKMYEEQQKNEKIPMEEYVAYQVELNKAQSVWHEAKAKNDYALFSPHLEQIIAFQKKMANYYEPDNPQPYNVLLNEYERGLTMETLDAYFARVKATIVPLLHRIVTEGHFPREDFLQKNYPIEKQREFSDFLMELMCIDRSHCAIGETEHPFTIEFNKNDVRITTKYKTDAVLSSMFSVVHEGGHALYELNLSDGLNGSYLAHGTSMGVHESQSRFFENIIGRSKAFCARIYPELTRLFPEQLSGVSAEELYLAANKVQPSLIRTEADELTYSLHIMIRYELEKKIFAGEVSVEQLPAEWNRLYKEYLGLDVPSDTDGILQDSHWSGGSFGYFPSYSIGSAYSAQIYAAMQKDLDVTALVADGNLQPIVSWLTQRIYRFGACIEPAEVLQNCCHAEFDPEYYINYLTDKFTTLYGLS